ncbi:MAG: hypothetical protein EOO16_06610 [Chitinophagaceae bacterium]|nr:MAG: hypothetical protein EOO16_06610 [Chitinophagaceae bacterium]
MKKVFTLLFLVGVAGGAFAQSDRAADVILGGNRTATQYPSGNQQEEINAINREYDLRISDVRISSNLTAAEKERRIQVLNQERARRINAVNRRYSGHSTTDRDYDRNNGKQKVKKNGKDNGNHYGWEKGKGNPHGNGKNKNKNKS